MGKKNSFFIHSIEIPQKCTKTDFFGEIKKYDTFAARIKIPIPCMSCREDPIVNGLCNGIYNSIQLII